MNSPRLRSVTLLVALLFLLTGGMRSAHGYDGCTGPISFPGSVVLQVALDALLDNACLIHDVCYSTCFPFFHHQPVQKETCDLVLLLRLENWCEDAAAREEVAGIGISPEDFLPACKAAMVGAFGAVQSPLGWSAFRNDQDDCEDCWNRGGVFEPTTHLCIFFPFGDPGDGGGPKPGNCPDVTPQTIIDCEQGGWWEESMCLCLGDGASPIVVDVGGKGFHLTGAEDGVEFDIDGNKAKEKLSWTEEGTQNAFLVLDRNLNGKIDDGRELFGNWTPQPRSRTRNGFLALAEFDQPEMGGNGDGKLTPDDLIFSQLQLWIDLDHDGVAGPLELWNLADWNLTAIDLGFERVRRQDEHGNKFRYRAGVTFADHRRSFAYDVFLVKGRR
jgi:hypothetical protein